MSDRDGKSLPLIPNGFFTRTSGRQVAVTGSPRLSWIKAVQTVVSGQYCDSSIILISANLVLHRTIERIHVGKKYGDIPRGIFVIRGENVVLLGEVVSDVCS